MGMERIQTDVLIVGAGLAGLSVALHVDPGLDVLVVAKRSLQESNSVRAQGGIACPLAPGDSVDQHVLDTLQAGAGLCREEVVREIIGESLAAVDELELLGVRFARRDETGGYDLGKEGGHSRRRILHAGDVTGAEVVKVLLERVQERPNCRLMDNLMAVDLITTGWLKIPGENRCVGGYFLRRNDGRIVGIRARAVILATGGAGKVYLYTSNAETATGDGVAVSALLVYR